MSSLNILDNNHIWYMVCKYFLYSVGFFSFCCLFLLLCKSFSLWSSPICWFLLLLVMFLVSYLKISLPRTMSSIFSMFLCFLLGVLWYQVYVKLLNPFWVKFCEWREIGVQFHCSACGYRVFPVMFIEETVLCPLTVLGSLVKY